MIFAFRLAGVLVGIGFAAYSLWQELQGQSGVVWGLLALVAVFAGAGPWFVNSRR